MQIGDRQVTTTMPPYVIAEIGVNHDGSIDRAIELVEIAKAAKADAIKLQLFATDLLLSRAAILAGYQKQSGADDPFAMLRSLELNIDQMSPIVEIAHRLKLHAIVTVFSVELVAQAERLPWDAYKTSSPDVINQPLLEALMRTRRPLLVSTGAASMQEIVDTVGRIGDYSHILMQCVSAYPTPDELASLAARQELAVIDPWAIGYSDHTPSIDTGAIAVASGARVLEKHLTHDRQANGPDHAASLSPSEFAEYVRLAHRADRMLGEARKQVLPIEEDVRKSSRQSITSKRQIRCGQAIQYDDLTIKRPGTGLAPSLLANVIGRTTRRDIEADMVISEDELE